MNEHPDHELEVLEEDQTVPPRPEEVIADAATTAEPAALAGGGEVTTSA